MRPIDAAKEAVSVVELVERLSGPGTRCGKEVFFRCPFHDDRNPSLRVNAHKGVWGKKGSLTQFLKNANKRDFTKKKQEALLDEDNWVAMEATKKLGYLGCLYGPDWALDIDDLEGREFIAKVQRRTGKKPGSYLGWNSFISLTPPRKKKGKKAEEEELTEAELEMMNTAFAEDDNAA